jgi:hypothetical protein
MDKSECRIVKHVLSINPTLRKVLRSLIVESFDAADWYVECLKETGELMPDWLIAYANATNSAGIRDDAARAFGASVALELFGPEEV